MFFWTKRSEQLYIKGFEKGFSTAVMMLPELSEMVRARIQAQAISETIERLNSGKLEKQSELQ